MKTDRSTASHDQIMLLDGSMGQELINRGVSGHGALWSAAALLESPQTVLQVHLDYIAAGADVICTNTYAATRLVLGEEGLENRFEALNRLACELAVEARERSGRDVLIAGSLPPYGESYRSDLVGPFELIEPLYREQAMLLAPYVDLFLCETMSSAEEGRAAVTGASVPGKPVWVSWTLADDEPPRLRSDETIEQAFDALDELNVEAFLLNCSLPEALVAGLPELLALTDAPVGAYANAFTPIPPMWEHRSDADLPPPRTDMGPEQYAGFAARWLDAGARIVGGCCEVGPAHIARLRQLIDSFRPPELA